MYRYNIDRDVDEGVFILKFGPVICLSPPADCLLDGYLLTDVKIPIPLCRDFVFPGNSMFSFLSCEDTVFLSALNKGSRCLLIDLNMHVRRFEIIQFYFCHICRNFVGSDEQFIAYAMYYCKY